MLGWHLGRYDLRPNIVSSLLLSTTTELIHPCFFRKNSGQKRCNLGNCPYDTRILFNADQISSGRDQAKARLEQISACTFSTSDIIHSGAVSVECHCESLFLTESLSDIPRPHLKSTRHDKKKQRGKSKQRTIGTDDATYVYLSSHNSGCLWLSLILKLKSVSLWKK